MTDVHERPRTYTQTRPPPCWVTKRRYGDLSQGQEQSTMLPLSVCLRENTAVYKLTACMILNHNSESFNSITFNYGYPELSTSYIFCTSSSFCSGHTGDNNILVRTKKEFCTSKNSMWMSLNEFYRMCSSMAMVMHNFPEHLCQ